MEINMPINVNAMDIPVTMAMGRNLLPTEPESTESIMMKEDSVIIVAIPATKTMNNEGERPVDILLFLI